jgi:hypothetical protein
MPFDMNEAIQLGQILQAAYEVPAEDLAQRAGETIPSQYDPLNRGYKILSTIYGRRWHGDSWRYRQPHSPRQCSGWRF